MASQPSKNDILLESGTNELEILVFTLGGQRYGVNVATVREVIEPRNIKSMPKSHIAVMGEFRLRDAVTSLVDLADRLIAESSIAAAPASAVAAPVAI